jgi:hypothetical protein
MSDGNCMEIAEAAVLAGRDKLANKRPQTCRAH